MLKDGLGELVLVDEVPSLTHRGGDVNIDVWQGQISKSVLPTHFSGFFLSSEKSVALRDELVRELSQVRSVSVFKRLNELTLKGGRTFPDQRNQIVLVSSNSRERFEEEKNFNSGRRQISEQMQIVLENLRNLVATQTAPYSSHHLAG